MLKRVMYCIVAVCFLATITFGGVQTCRLGSSLEECERYRIELAAATDRQSEIAGVVGHTSLVLGETVNSVAELREQLKAVEDDYNRLYSLCFDNGSLVHNGEEQVNGGNNE